MDITNILERIKKSEFRSSFYLSKEDKEYYYSKGGDVIRSHAVDFVKNRLGDAYPKNDTKQTPYKGHPIFKAMHACACCCRSCLMKWHGIPKGRELTQDEQNDIVNLLMAWVKSKL